MTEDALEYIKSHPEGVLQSDLWKALGIDSRKCSRIVARLLKDRQITREIVSADGIRTYRLTGIRQESDPGRFSPLLAEGCFEPCAGCIDECVPEHCAKLSEWVFAIVFRGSGQSEAV
ncbi:MAG: hypothetical protein A4E45_00604 [Methanosaeta sp. PtaB.Bin039]|nr:MAG: hypothetical protein A4E45_00604 [Methanosaeta sp. PtaB.Bin039]